MYIRFTERARKVMQLANHEAHRLRREYIDTEHVLLGLVSEDLGVAVKLLKRLSIEPRAIRLEIEKNSEIGSDPGIMTGKLPQTARLKKVIEYATEEARDLSHKYVGTEHLLLGLMREHQGLAAQILTNLGLELEELRTEVRSEVLRLLQQDSDVGERDNVAANLTTPDVDLSKLPTAIANEVHELGEQIAQLHVEKEVAVAVSDFERAAILRDRADKLTRKRHEIIAKAELEEEHM